jgi:hypothetical protein
MKAATYPLALIFVALCAHRTEASPCLEGLMRLALEDQASFSAPADPAPAPIPVVAPAPVIALVPTLGLDAAPAPALAPAPAAALAPAATVTAPALLLRAVQALRTVAIVPLRYGCAFFGAGPDTPKPVPEPAPKAKPRMLTLF